MENEKIKSSLKIKPQIIKKLKNYQNLNSTSTSTSEPTTPTKNNKTNSNNQKLNSKIQNQNQNQRKRCSSEPIPIKNLTKEKSNLIYSILEIQKEEIPKKIKSLNHQFINQSKLDQQQQQQTNQQQQQQTNQQQQQQTNQQQQQTNQQQQQQLKLPSLITLRNEFENNHSISSPSTSKSTSPKSSVKSPSKLSRILQPSIRQKELDERIPPLDEPLVITTLDSNNDHQNRTKDLTETENQIPKITRLSKRVQAMKAASALMKFNLNSNSIPINNTTTTSFQKSKTKNIIKLSSTCSNQQNKPIKARREKSTTLTTNQNQKHINQLNNNNNNNKIEPTEAIKLSKLTTRQTNLNKIRFSIIKVEDVHMNSFRPPSPESKFRKSNFNFNLVNNNNNNRKKNFYDLEDDQIEEIHVSLPTTHQSNTSTTTTTTTTPTTTTTTITQDHLHNNYESDHPRAQLNQDYKSTNEITKEKTLQKAERKKKVRWNEKNLTINLQEQFHHQQHQHQQEVEGEEEGRSLIERRRKEKQNNHNHNLMERKKIKFEDHDLLVDQVQLDDDTLIDPFFKISSKLPSSPDPNPALDLDPLNRSTSSRLVSSPPSASSPKVKPILKKNFRSAQERKKRIEINLKNQNSKDKEEEFEKDSEKDTDERECEYQYDLDDYGNLLIKKDEMNITSSTNSTTIDHDDLLKSLNLEPLFVKVSRRIWLH